jgi:hypothetical protein
MSTDNEMKREPHRTDDDYADYLGPPNLVYEAEQRLAEAERDLAEVRQIVDIMESLALPDDTPVGEVREQILAERDRRRAARAD